MRMFPPLSLTPALSQREGKLTMAQHATFADPLPCGPEAQNSPRGDRGSPLQLEGRVNNATPRRSDNQRCRRACCA